MTPPLTSREFSAQQRQQQRKPAASVPNKIAPPPVPPAPPPVEEPPDAPTFTLTNGKTYTDPAVMFAEWEADAAQRKAERDGQEARAAEATRQHATALCKRLAERSKNPHAERIVL